MNTGGEPEKESVSILSHHRDNHTTMMALAPVLTMAGAFLIFLLLVGGIVFFVVNRAGFLAFMPNVFTGAIELLKWLAIVLVVGLAVKFVLGSAIKDVFAPLVDVLLGAWGELRKDRVVDSNESFLAYTGDSIKVVQHEDVRTHYNIRQMDGPAPVPLLESPKNQIFYARDLYERGELFKAITAGRIILGWGEKEGTRKLWMIPRTSYFSTIAGGLPSSGKTTTAYWILVQQILVGAKIILIDPHMYYQDENGNKSLTKELQPFENAYIFPPIDASSPSAIMQRVRWMKQTIDERKRPGYVAKLSDIVILVIDEVNSVFELAEINKQLADELSYIQREGRKFGIHTLLLGHRWSKEDIGRVNIRTVASTVMAHKQNDENQAAILVGGKRYAKDVLDLTPGSYMFRSIHAMIDDEDEQEYSLTRIQTPMISAVDASWVVQLKQKVEVWLGTADPTADPTANLNNSTKSGNASIRPGQWREVESDPLLSPELLRKMERVSELDATGEYSQTELIGMVWGPEYTNGRRFNEAQAELKLLRQAQAKLLARLRSNV